MKRLEFGIEKDGQPYLRVWHGKENREDGKSNASKIEFENMRLFSAFPAEYIEIFIEKIWGRPGIGEFIAADEQFYRLLDGREKMVKSSCVKNATSP